MKQLLAILTWLPLHLAAQTVTFNQVSDPAGIINDTANLQSGSQTSTILAPSVSDGLRFTHWTVNGTTFRHLLGTPLNPVSFTILENTTATAHYLTAQDDLDQDGVPDWFEIYYYGSSSNNAAYNGDGDAHDLLEESIRGQSPLLSDQSEVGGVLEQRSPRIVVIQDPGKHAYTEVSAPGGIIQVQHVLNNGSLHSSSIAPDVVDGLRFTGWSGPGISPYDFFGRARWYVTVTATNDVPLTAHYLPQQQDADSDDVPDWFEYRFYQDTQPAATHNADGDELDLLEEYLRGLHPLLKDTILPGGIAESRSSRIQVTLPGLFSYHITSNPTGIYDQQDRVTSNTVVQTPFANPEADGLRFGYWTVNGQRATRFNGQSADLVSQAITTETLFVAHYFLEQDDTDIDGVPDWFEWNMYGTLNQAANADTDQDSLDLSQEFTAGTHPLLYDELRPGGIVEAQSTSAIVDLQFFPRETHTLKDTIVQHVWSDDPFTPNGLTFSGPTRPGLGDWDGDGDLDLFVLDGTGALSSYENIGSRFALNLREHAGLITPPVASGGIALGDWNQDGRADIVYATTNVGCWSLKASTGDFSTSVSGFDHELIPNVQAVSPAIGDLNNDGLPDLVGLMADGRVHLYPHSGNNSQPYSTSQVVTNLLGVPVPNAIAIRVADLNLDGMPDVLISDDAGRAWQFNNLGTGFQIQSRIWGGTGSGFADGFALAVGDLDGDGDNDAVAGFDQGGLMFLRDPKMARPLNLQAFGGQDSVRLEWLPAYQSRIKGYHVYRATHPSSLFNRANQVLVGAPHFLNTNITAVAVYDYYVTAVSEFLFPGNSLPRPVESPASDIASALAGSTQLTLPDTCGEPGGELVVQINVGHIGGVVGDGMEIQLTYDPLLLTPITQVNAAQSTTLRSPLTANLAVSDNSASANGQLVITASGADPIFGYGHLLDVVFQVSPSALAGQTSNLSFAHAVIKNAGGVSLPVDFSDTGTAHIEAAFVRGDINADGLLDARDLTLMMQLAAGLRPATAFELMAADLNGNQRIDAPDAQLLARLIRGLKLNP